MSTLFKILQSEIRNLKEAFPQLHTQKIFTRNVAPQLHIRTSPINYGSGTKKVAEL